MLNSVTSILRKQFPDHKLHLVHRLDRETSGVLLLAKDPSAARALTDQFFAHAISKEYLAIVTGGSLLEDPGKSRPLGPPKAARSASARPPAADSRPSPTSKRLDAAAGFSVVAARPRTSRLHQIRVHLAHLGLPVLGDKLYTGEGEVYMKAVRREACGRRPRRAWGPPGRCSTPGRSNCITRGRGGRSP